MLAVSQLVKGLVARFLPAPSADGPESEGYARFGRYRELSALSMVRKAHLLADEGGYFVGNNAQTGIAEGLNTGFVATTPTLYLANTADPNDPSAKSISLDYIDLSVQTAGVTATSVAQKLLALYLDKGNNYSSGGTDLSSKIWNVNPKVGANASVAKLYFGVLTTTTPTVAKGVTRPIVGQRSYRIPVTATTAPDAVGDRLRLEFGNVEAESIAQLGTTGALMANVYQTVLKLPPVVLAPGWSLALYTWTSCNTYSNGTIWLPEAGWWER